MKNKELDIVNGTVPLLNTIGSAQILYVTAELEPFSNQQKPDLVFYPKGKFKNVLFVEFKIAPPSGFSKNYWANFDEKKSFVESSSEVNLTYIFAANVKIEEQIIEKLKGINVQVWDEVESSELLCNKIKKWAMETKKTCNCDFCNEIQNQGGNKFSDIYSKLNIKTRIIGENDKFVVLPTIGQLFKYSLLILPKRHIESMSKLDKEGIESLVDIVKKTKEKLSDYGKVVIFEHGAQKDTGGSCGIYHAHVHVIPLPSDLNLSSFFYSDSVVKKYENLNDCYSDLRKSSQYLMTINTDGSLYAVDTSDNFQQYPSQFFRKKLVEYYNINRHWDWREYLTSEPDLLQTIEEINF